MNGKRTGLVNTAIAVGSGSNGTNGRKDGTAFRNGITFAGRPAIAPVGRQEVSQLPRAVEPEPRSGVSRQKVWTVLLRWVLPPVGFSIGGAAVMSTGKSDWALLTFDLPLALVVATGLAFGMLLVKCVVVWSYRQLISDLANFLAPGGHCFLWIMSHVVSYALTMVAFKWLAFSAFGHPTTGGPAGILTGAIDGAILGGVMSVHTWLRDIWSRA